MFCTTRTCFPNNNKIINNNNKYCFLKRVANRWANVVYLHHLKQCCRAKNHPVLVVKLKAPIPITTERVKERATQQQNIKKKNEKRGRKKIQNKYERWVHWHVGKQN